MERLITILISTSTGLLLTLLGFVYAKIDTVTTALFAQVGPDGIPLPESDNGMFETLIKEGGVFGVFALAVIVVIKLILDFGGKKLDQLREDHHRIEDKLVSIKDKLITDTERLSSEISANGKTKQTKSDK